jgi:Na+/phosphate symporter
VVICDTDIPLLIVVFPFVPFLLAMVFVLLRYTDSDYPFGIFKLFSHHMILVKIYAIANLNGHTFEIYKNISVVICDTDIPLLLYCDV